MRLTPLLFFFLCYCNAYSQTNIHGSVVDASGNALQFAEVALRSLPDSVVIKGDITDSAGNFQININKLHTSLLEVQSSGYERKWLMITDTISGVVKVNIQLKENAHQLKAVAVTTAKPLLERKADRMIFNVASSISSVGSDAYELLKKAPGVRVNNAGSVSIIGKSTVGIMINDKVQYVTGTELEALLRSLSADNIDKIEVITTPPARYDAEGNAGLINIVTKKSGKNGFNGNVTLNYQQRTYGSERLVENLNYRQGKLNIYSTGATTNFAMQSTQKTTIPYATQREEQQMDQHNTPFYNRYELGADYSINDKNIIGMLLTLGSTDRTTQQYYKAPTLNEATGALDSTLYNIADEGEKVFRKVLNLNYEWKIDTTGKKLNIDVDYYTRPEKNTRNYHSQTVLPDGTPTNVPFYTKSYGIQKVDIASVKADLTLPTEIADFTFGAKVSTIHTYSDNNFTYLQSGVYVNDTNRSNSFDYRENTQAAYLSVAKEWNKWEAQVGLRAENTQTKGISYTISQTNTNNYFQLFPTAYLQYSPNEDNVININYARRIGRPDYSDMNPFRTYSTGGSYETGNPFLQPSFYHEVELSYTLKSKYTLSAMGGMATTIPSRVSFIDASRNTFYYTKVNAGTLYNIGASATMVLNPFKWWESNTEIGCFYGKIKSTYYSATPSVNGIFSGAFETSNTFTLNRAKTLLFELAFEYNSRQQDEFDIQRRYYILGAGAKALFFDKQLVLGINGADILRSEKYYFTNIYNGVIEDNYFDNRCQTISLTWKFGNNKIKAKRERETGSEETKRAGQ
ncbi:MAG: TonB-dependent receptor [Bacteroidetes bacterium]|nr:TonB-dependent receptor [Bacteroidota bacterium]